eukprot:4529228-Amphidinium_carterae.1
MAFGRMVAVRERFGIVTEKSELGKKFKPRSQGHRPLVQELKLGLFTTQPGFFFLGYPYAARVLPLVEEGLCL